jgi:hypothetical protein
MSCSIPGCRKGGCTTEPSGPRPTESGNGKGR